MIKRALLLFFLIAAMLSSYSYAQQEDGSATLIDIKNTTQQIREKEKELAIKEQELAAREERLIALEQDLSSREEELSKLRTEISALIKTIDNNNKEELDSLAKLYGSTKPKAAAGILVKTDITKTAAIMKRMTPMNAGRIMAEIGKQDPDYASRLTSYMSGTDPVNIPSSGSASIQIQ